MVFRIIIVLFFFSVSAFSQEKFIKHKISKGENLTIIAKKYGLKAKDIQEANPDATKILKLNSILLIPNKNVNSTSSIVNNTGSHEVLQKETLWGISKKYNVSVEDIKKANPVLETEGLKIGQQIIIPSNSTNAVSFQPEKEKSEILSANDVEIAVEVQPKETKYAIAKRYGITVAELERQNPSVKQKLPVGYVLKIKTTKEKADEVNATIASPEKDTVVSSDQIADNSDVNSSQDTENNVSFVQKKDSVFVYNGNHAELIDRLIFNATENIGTRYRSGGTTKAGFDCSGLMFCTFGNFDIKLPRSSIEQSRIGTKVSSAEAQKGDLIFFKTNGRSRINHVGMVVEVIEGEIKFVHSSTHGGVMISSTKEPYYQRTFTQVNRILN